MGKTKKATEVTFCFNKGFSKPILNRFSLSGPGGGRTHVQTRNFLVFYMLIL